MRNNYYKKRNESLKALAEQVNYLRETAQLQSDYIRIVELYLATDNKTLKQMIAKANPYDRTYAEAIL